MERGRADCILITIWAPYFVQQRSKKVRPSLRDGKERGALFSGGTMENQFEDKIEITVTDNKVTFKVRSMEGVLPFNSKHFDTHLYGYMRDIGNMIKEIKNEYTKQADSRSGADH